MKILFELFWVCFRISLFTYGGGHVIFLMFRNEMAKKRQWVRDEELLDFYSTGLSLPGVVAVNMATFIGYNVKGILGSIVAALGIILPSILVVSVVAFFLDEFIHTTYVMSVLAGIKIAVVAILANFVLDMGKKNLRHWKPMAVFVVSLLVLLIWNVHIVLVIMLSGLIGLAFNWKKVRTG